MQQWQGKARQSKPGLLLFSEHLESDVEKPHGIYLFFVFNHERIWDNPRVKKKKKNADGVAIWCRSMSRLVKFSQDRQSIEFAVRFGKCFVAKFIQLPVLIEIG